MRRRDRERKRFGCLGEVERRHEEYEARVYNLVRAFRKLKLSRIFQAKETNTAIVGQGEHVVGEELCREKQGVTQVVKT